MRDLQTGGAVGRPAIEESGMEKSVCVRCAADQGERLEVRLNDRTKPERNRAFLSRHPGYHKDYCEEHKERQQELKRKWHEKHREEQLQRMREYYAANRAKWPTVYRRKKAA